MSQIYNDYDSQFDEPDPKTKYLIEQVKNIKMSMSDNTDLFSRNITRLDDTVERLAIVELYSQMTFLAAAGEISKDELKRINTIFQSPDKENHVLAREIINGKMKDFTITDIKDEIK